MERAPTGCSLAARDPKQIAGRAVLAEIQVAPRQIVVIAKRNERQCPRSNRLRRALTGPISGVAMA
ncbi:MAG: hypothetical protein ABI467_21775 [Kofleriaceae bacterium]